MFPNVRNQYHWNALANRALNPEGPLAPVNDYLMEYLQPPEHLYVNAKPYLEKLDTLFRFCKSNKDINKKTKTSSFTSKLNQNEECNVNDFNKDVSENVNNSDEEFFIQDNIDFDMEKVMWKFHFIFKNLI
jgi:hypothetical protein